MRKLSNYNTGKFYFNPQKEGALKKAEEEGLFDFDDAGYGKEKFCTYIALMYDPYSELRKEIPEYPKRKAIAAELSGFSKTNGRFSPRVEEYLVGTNKRFNEAIVQYLSKTNSRDYMTMCVKDHAYTKLLIEAMSSYDEKINKLTKDMLKELNDYEMYLFGGEEVKKMREALYESGENIRLQLRREDISDKSDEEIRKETSPYGKEYEEGAIKFAGDIL